jgi:predicted nucleic acid-binding Zn ribbon protein
MTRSSKSLGNALAELLSGLGIESNVKRHEVIALWPDIAGDRIAAISTAIRVEGQILVVKVDNCTWRNELLYVKQSLLEKISGAVGNNIVKDIRFI